MASRLETIPHRRAIVDRRALDEALATSDRAGAASLLRRALADGRAEIARRLAERPYAGSETAAAYAFLTDQVTRLAFDHVTRRMYPLANPTTSERLLLMAVGGYGRGEMALHSDVDLAFVTPWKQTRWTESVTEEILYLLWDLGLKVSQSSRSIDEMAMMVARDQTVLTAILEARYVWGDESVYAEARARFWERVGPAEIRAFAKQKLDEREARHQRMGDSRYVVEPNVKEGKGGLRDLHTLYWIGKFAYRLRAASDLVGAGLLTAAEWRAFHRAERFLWAVRCHLHVIAGRAEERLTFDFQSEIARRMNYADRPGNAAVERFMRHYFLNAKTVGDLTGVFLAHLDERFARRGQRYLSLPRLRRRPRKLEGFMLDRGRLAVPDEKFLAERPVRLIQMFALADRHGLEIHPMAMRAAAADARLINAAIRADPEANALFLDILTSPRDPETVLRWMNEAGVFGRFIPDFGRVVAKMQFDMYHHYTVDEHTIRAIGLLARIEQRRLKDEHPLATALFKHVASRRVLYVAVLLHDIAKGRGGDHSELGAELALSLCPRLGLDPAETQTVAWLVRWHLLMSATAQKRDLADPKTIQDFVERVKSLERLRLLYILTVVDIRAVGPGTWNGWKSELLRELFEAAEERLRLGHKETGREARVAALKDEVAARLGWQAARFAAVAGRLPDSYWLAEPIDAIERNARLLDGIGPADEPERVDTAVLPALEANLVSVLARDRPGLFYRLAGAISLAGGNIIDARIHTTHDGLALDNFLVQGATGGPFSDRRRLRRLVEEVRRAIAGQEPALARLGARAPALRRAEAFTVAPAIFVDNNASSRYSVVEVNARDRAALLCELARAITESKAQIRSAHIATYGERAVDVFYLTGPDGGKIESAPRLRALKARLLKAAAGGTVGRREAA